MTSIKDKSLASILPRWSVCEYHESLIGDEDHGYVT